MAKSAVKEQETSTLTTLDASASQIAELRKGLEAAYRDVVKAHDDSVKELQKKTQEAYDKYAQTIRDTAHNADAYAKAEREHVQSLFDIQERYGQSNKEAARDYEQAVKAIWRKIDLKDMDIKSIAEASGIIWYFSYCE